MSDPMSERTAPPAPDPDAGLPGGITPELLMRFLDGELTPEERARVEAALAGATEVQRDLLVYRHIREDFSNLRLRTGGGRRSVWERVHARITRPMGWIFFCTGTAAWLLYASWVYFSSATPTFEKLMSAAVVIGVLLLFASVIHERYREWLTDPYRDVER
jgi:hypothetical protein